MNTADLIYVAFALFGLLLYVVDAHQRIGDLRDEIKQIKKDILNVRRDMPVNQKREALNASVRAREVKEAAERFAQERNARNREVKRRLKERKAAALQAKGKWGWGPPMTEEQKHTLLVGVKESLDQEQVWRNQVAAENGWPIHPNDMDLEGEERAAMMEAWRNGEPPKPEWLNEQD